MEWLQNLLSRFTGLFKWWFILQPWEQGIRVRLGRHITKFGGGIHFMIPYVDRIFYQNTRKRATVIDSQTITTLDGKTITLAGSLQYRIDDILPLYQHLHTAEDTIKQEVQGMLTDYIAWKNFDKCRPEDLMAHVTSKLTLGQYGLADFRFILTDYAVVKTYRIIQGDMERWNEENLSVKT